MGLTTRTNSGKQTGLLIAQLGNWNLRQTSDTRYKVAAIDAVNGKANYAFGVKDGRLDTHAGLDCTKLGQDHPELLKTIEEYFKAQSTPAEIKPEEDADPYGDLAISRRQKLSPEQNWRRGLLQMRRLEFEHAAVQAKGTWEAAIRMLWKGVFDAVIPQEALEKAQIWVTHRKGAVDLSALLNAEKAYYSGKFAPHSSINLEAQLDMLAGAMEFENVEEETDGRETVLQRDDSGSGESESSGNDRDQNGTVYGTTIRTGGTGEEESGSTSGSNEPGASDPLAAFR